MKSKVIAIPTKASKSSMKENLRNKLKLKFPRIEFNPKDMEPIPDEEKKLYGFPKEMMALRWAGSMSSNGYEDRCTTSLSKIIEVKLDHVIYRLLKETYGFPDPLVAWITKEEKGSDEAISGKGFPTEWHYLFDLGNECCIEIFSRYRDHDIQFTIWIVEKAKIDKIPEELINNFNDFVRILSELGKIYDNEYNIDTEEEKVKKIFGHPARFVNNLYIQNIKSAEAMIDFASDIVPEIEDLRQDLWEKGLRAKSFNQFHKKSVFFVSAISFSFMALEGFVNLLYKFFIRPEYTKGEFRRITKQGDLDLRVLHLPVYCKGFREIIIPEEMLYKELRNIRQLRNDFFHANITAENEGVLTFEDFFHFEYNPIYHRKKRKKMRKEKKMHTQHFAYGRVNADDILDRVKKIVDAIIEKLDNKEKAWVKTWTYAGRIAWIPESEDYERMVALSTHWKDS